MIFCNNKKQWQNIDKSNNLQRQFVYLKITEKRKMSSEKTVGY